MHGCMSMVLMSSIMLALTGVKLYAPNSFQLLQMTPLILPTVSLAAEKTPFRVMLLPLLLWLIMIVQLVEQVNRVND